MSVVNFADKLKEFGAHDAKLIAETLQKLRDDRLEACRMLSVYLNTSLAINVGVLTILASLLVTVEGIEKLSDRRRLDINLIANNLAQILSELPHRGRR